MKIISHPDLFAISFKYDLAKIKFMHQLGLKWDKKNRLWYQENPTRLLLQNFVTLFPDQKQYAPEWFEPDYDKWAPSDYLMDHQLKAAEKAVKTKRYGWFHGIGSGKTVLGIEFIKQKKTKTLVVCPLSIIRRAWLDDLEKFAPELIAANLWELKKPKSVSGRSCFKTKLANSQVCVINYESFKSLLPQLKEAEFQMLIIDESSKCASGQTEITKQLIKFSADIDFVYLLSGNPAPNNEMEYWGQTQIINPLLFGSSFYRFRQIWFMSSGYGGFKYTLNPQLREVFLEKIASISEVVERDDVLDLPEPNFCTREVYLDKNELGTYTDMKRHLELEFQGVEVVAPNAAVKQMKLREGTSGFYYRDELKTSATGKLKKISVPVHIGDSKLKELEILLNEIGDHQVVIWNHFHYEGNQITKMLDDKNKTWIRCDGTEPNQDKKDQWIKEFMEGEHQYLVAHPESIGHGHRLENAHNAIYFSISHSYRLHEQSLGRLQRKNQLKRCNFFFLIAVGTVDEIIMEVLKEKGDVVQAVFDYIKGRM